ncbi:MAG: DUF2249 domain-containing protein [Actinomycetota bacterium]
MSLDTHQISPARPEAAVLPASTTNADVIDAITRHHTTLVNDMRMLTAEVVDSARSGKYDQSLARLMAWFARAFLPHAHAEETALYSAGSGLESTRLLVDGMIAEHRAIESLMTDLTYARDPFSVIAATAAVEAVFTVHLSKENDLLLPALDAAAVDLEQALAGKLEILGQPSAPDELDVRTVPHSGRHDVIFARLDQLLPGDTFVIVNDHDPKPLRYQTEALWPGQYTWSYLETGPHQWRVAITRAG